MGNTDNSISLEEAAAQRGVSKRRITQQVAEGGWGIQKVARDRYVLCEDGNTHKRQKDNKDPSMEFRLQKENAWRDRLEETEDVYERTLILCILTEIELDRLAPEGKGPEFKDEDRPLKDEEIDWLLNSSCYQVGIVSSHDLKAMGNSLRKSYKALRNFGDLNELKLEESAWSFMALDSIFGLWEHRKARGDRRVIIAGSTGLPRK